VLREREVLLTGADCGLLILETCVVLCSRRGNSKAAAEDGQTRGEADTWCSQLGYKH